MRRPLALTALTLALVAATLAVTGVQQASAATAAPAQVCILGICLGPTSSPSATASPSATGTSAPAASPVPSPSVSLPLPTATPSGSASPGKPGGAATASPSKSAKQKSAAADPGLVATSATEVLSAGSATLTGFAYQGNVNVPVAGGGTQRMMKFTADSISLAGGVTDTVTEGGATTSTTSPALSFGGHVRLYATRLCGSLAGVPVCFSPTTVSGVLLSLANLVTGVVPLTLTSVTTDQPLVLADALQTGALAIG